MRLVYHVSFIKHNDIFLGAVIWSFAYQKRKSLLQNRQVPRHKMHIAPTRHNRAPAAVTYPNV